MLTKNRFLRSKLHRGPVYQTTRLTDFNNIKHYKHDLTHSSRNSTQVTQPASFTQQIQTFLQKDYEKENVSNVQEYVIAKADTVINWVWKLTNDDSVDTRERFIIL
jgi:hypothetical protein